MLNIRLRTVLLIVSLCCFCGAAYAHRPNDFGERWVRQNPFVITGFCFQSELPFDALQYHRANFNNVVPWNSYDTLFPPIIDAELPWFVHVNNRSPFTQEEIHNFISNTFENRSGGLGCLIHDEPQRLEMPQAAATVAWTQQNYPDKLVFSNALPLGATAQFYYGSADYPAGYDYEQYVDDFISIINPDVFMYDIYPFTASALTSTAIYPNAEIVSRLCEQAGKPWWVWTQSYSDSYLNLRMPSESDLRMHVFTHLCYGCKGIGYFTYNYAAGPAMIDRYTGQEQPIYYAAKSLNNELENLGQTLRLLTRTDTRYIRLPGFSLPYSTVAWSFGAGNDNHVQSISLENPQAAPYNSGQEPAVLVGFFTDDAGSKYMLIANLWHAENKSAADCELDITIQFDSSINSMLRLNRLTGYAEVLSFANNTLTLSIPGGTGELIKYNNGPFAGSKTIGGLNWMVPHVVNDEASMWGQRLAVKSDDVPAIVYARDQAHALIYTEDLGVTKEAVQQSVWNNFTPDIAIDPCDNAHIIWFKAGSPNSMWYRGQVNGSFAGTTAEEITTNCVGNIHPRIDADADGNAHVIWALTASPGSVEYRSRVAGVWGTVETVDPSTPYNSVTYSPMIRAYNGDAYLFALPRTSHISAAGHYGPYYARKSERWSTVHRIPTLWSHSCGTFYTNVTSLDIKSRGTMIDVVSLGDPSGFDDPVTGAVYLFLDVLAGTTERITVFDDSNGTGTATASEVSMAIDPAGNHHIFFTAQDPNGSGDTELMMQEVSSDGGLVGDLIKLTDNEVDESQIDAEWGDEKLHLIYRTSDVDSVKLVYMAAELRVPQTCEEAINSRYWLAGDVNSDCSVDLLDISIMAGNWLKCLNPADASCATNWEQNAIWP